MKKKDNLNQEKKLLIVESIMILETKEKLLL